MIFVCMHESDFCRKLCGLSSEIDRWKLVHN
nr:MAG TPA: hypothetical protein [Caudoviricetes sp.]